MKKLIILLLTVVLFTSCKRSSIDVMELNDGKIVSLYMRDKVHPEVGDTIVIQYYNAHPSFYGKYIGITPSSFVNEVVRNDKKNYIPVRYSIAIRIK